MDYWDIKEVVREMIPRQNVLVPVTSEGGFRKGRRAGYKEYKLFPQGWNEYKRELGGMKSAFEVSCKAAGCPSPLNLDVWDGKVCYFNCNYCFANHFRSTLYENFFDRVPDGLRHVDLGEFERELGDLMSARFQSALEKMSPEKRAIALRIPIRLGVRFENFLPQEKRDGISLHVLRLLAKYHYPVIIDTKSILLAEDEYLEAMASNPGGVVVQLSLSSANPKLLKAMEPGAPSPAERFEAARRLNEAGIRAVLRVEPFLPFLADSRSEMGEYASRAKEAGVEWMCWDSFSYSTASAVTRRLFQEARLDFDRMFLAASDSRMMTGILLYGMMENFRSLGFRCSTYDDMNSHLNEDTLCCNVTGALSGYRMNYGSTKAAEAFIHSRQGPTGWADYNTHVMKNGGFLSEELREEMWKLWNHDGNAAYGMGWLSVVPSGRDEHGLKWAPAEKNPNLERGLEVIRGN